MIENEPWLRPELTFTEASREEFLIECATETQNRIATILKTEPKTLKLHPNSRSIPEIQRRGLDLYEQITAVQDEGLKRTYPSDIDIVHIYSGPFTAFTRGMEYKEGTDERQNFNRSRDNDRDDAGLAIAREVARTRLREQGLDSDLNGVPESYFPYLVYNGQPIKRQNGQELYENDDFRAYTKKAAEKGFISEQFLKNKLFVFDTVENTEGKIVPIVHTGHQVRNFVQQTLRADGMLFSLYQQSQNEGRPLNVAVVSHNSDIIRIPFYFGLWGLWKETSPKKYEPLIDLSLYGVRDRSDTVAREILKYELVGLGVYAAQGSLSTEPYPYVIPAVKKQ